MCLSFCPQRGLCMMSLPVWLTGPMFLLGGLGFLCHVPSRRVSLSRESLIRGVSVQRASVRETPSHGEERMSHPTGMLSCFQNLTSNLNSKGYKKYIYALSFSFDHQNNCVRWNISSGANRSICFMLMSLEHFWQMYSMLLKIQTFILCACKEKGGSCTIKRSEQNPWILNFSLKSMM